MKKRFVQRVIKIGDSVGITLDKELLDLHKIKIGDIIAVDYALKIYPKDEEQK